MATGCLSNANLPRFEGLESFAGEVHHTGRWPHAGVDFRGKRVGVIGTGSTATQITTALVPRVARYSLFQRTAQWVMAQENPAYTASEQSFFRGDPASMTETHGDIVERESRMRVLNMARVLGWPGADGNGEPDRRFHAMRSLLFETDVVVDPERLPSAVKDIEELTVNFLRRYALDARRSRAHRAAVRRRVSQRLVRAAAACARGDDWAKAWGLVLLGGRLRWHTVFQRRLWLAGEPCQHEPARVPRIVRLAIHARA